MQESVLDTVIRLMAADIEEMLALLNARDAAIAAGDVEFMKGLGIVPEKF